MKKGVPNGRGKEYCDGKLVKEGIFEEGMMSDGNKVFYVDCFKNLYLYPATSEDWDNPIIVKLLKDLINK